MTDFATFGDPRRFEIAVRWSSDSEPRTRRPADYGWSMGDLRLTVFGKVLTESVRGRGRQSHVGWYLAPFFCWLASNWIALFQEEDFDWRERSGAPAVLACQRAMDQWMSARDPEGRESYKRAQAWYFRHAIRSAAEGGLFPDLFIRRFVDEVELSWSAAPPVFTPDGFAFVLDPGTALLPPEDVAGPLWEALTWAASTCPADLPAGDVAAWERLAKRIEAVPTPNASVLDKTYVDERILELVHASLDRLGRLDLMEDKIDPSRTFVREFSPAVLMFGGVSPQLDQADVERLCGLLAARQGRGECDGLADLAASSAGGALSGLPHENGYALAQDLLDELDGVGQQGWIDVRAIASDLEIDVMEEALDTNTIRGVAIAGHDFKPAILVNTRSVFNRSENGRRFTIAHEIFHILHDRTRARRVTHVSGPWVAPGIERRANAFAAYLLMPRALVWRIWTEGQTPQEKHDALADAAKRLRVSERALVEHLYNLGIIDDFDRERLRSEARLH